MTNETKRQQAWEAGRQAAMNLYQPDNQFDMQTVASIIAMTAMEAYEKKLRELNRRKPKC